MRCADRATFRGLPLLCGLLLSGCSPSAGEETGVPERVGASAAACTTGSGPLPRPLELPGAEANGAFDADLARDVSGRLWMAYSGVTGPAGSGRVSTHLAFSDDDGATWCDQGVVNAAESVPDSERPARLDGRDGHWNHEVPALAYDAAAPAASRWTLVWHRYLHLADDDPASDDRRFEYGWIAIRSAATPEGLAAAPERKLFSSLAYHALPEVEAYNEAVPGGSPEKRWDLDPDLGECLVFTEPALLAADGGLYAALFCFRSADLQEIVLTRFSHATGTWSHRGTLLSTADARALHPALVGFNAPDLYAVGSGTRLVVSPTDGAAYQGCLEYPVDLAAARLDVPTSSLPRNPDPEVFQSGACTYHEGAVTGLIVGDTYLSGVQFRLVATGRVP